MGWHDGREVGKHQMVIEKLTQNTLAAAESGEPAPLALIVMFGILSLVLLVVHILFRVGQPRSRWDHSGHMRGLQVLWGFSALPGAIGAGLLFFLMAADRVWSFSSTVFPWVGLPLILGFVACGAWSYKEFERPTLRRTPDWARVAMERDPVLRDIVLGKRRRR